MKINVERLNAAKTRTGMNVNLREANLYWADLREADLHWANLYRADLRGADLRRADPYGANLRGADLYGADLNLQSHDLLSELMRQAAGDDLARLQLAGLPLVTRNWCWQEYLALEVAPELRRWVLEILRPYVNDDAPALLRRAIREMEE